MTSLSDKVARVKELDAENRQTVFPDKVRLEMAALITQLWEENQKQREVLVMAREGLESVLGAAMFDRPEIHRRIGKETLTAIDNVINK